MNKSLRILLVHLLVAGLSLLSPRRLESQTFKTLGNFTPQSLCLSGGILYGEAIGGGSASSGTIFALNPDSGILTNVYDFGTSPSNRASAPVSLVLLGNRLYGTTLWSGLSAPTNDCGTVFSMNPDGTGFKILHVFAAGEGKHAGGLNVSGGTLYGATFLGGTGPTNGTVYKLNTDGTGFQVLHAFDGADGSSPSGLIATSNRLFGTSFNGGLHGRGTVFRLNSDGTMFTTLYSFTGADDGAEPFGLLLTNSFLYGATVRGGTWSNGTIFKIGGDGSGFTNLYTFTPTATPYSGQNSDGAAPASIVALSGDVLLGTAQFGGNSGNGTIFSMRTDGTDFSTLYSFTATSLDPLGVYTNSDGACPESLLVLGDTMYGATIAGGILAKGTIFSFSLSGGSPALTIKSTGANIVLSWPTNSSRFTLQSATSLASPVWTTNLPTPVVINGQNVVTNAISSTQEFFRLSQ